MVNTRRVIYDRVATSQLPQAERQRLITEADSIDDNDAEAQEMFDAIIDDITTAEDELARQAAIHASLTPTFTGHTTNSTGESGFNKAAVDAKPERKLTNLGSPIPDDKRYCYFDQVTKEMEWTETANPAVSVTATTHGRSLRHGDHSIQHDLENYQPRDDTQPLPFFVQLHNQAHSHCTLGG